MNIVGIIPARYGSLRLHAKPLIDLCGKTMIQHVYERTRQATLLTRVIVATDHERIVEAVRNFGGEVVVTPAELRSGSDRIAYVAKNLADADIIVNIQGDEPLIVPEMIDQAVKPLIDHAAIQIGTLVKIITSTDDLINPNIVKVVIDRYGFGMYFSRSPIPHVRDTPNISTWLLKNTFYKHIGLYVYRKNFLVQYASWPETALEQVEKLEQLRIIEHGYKIKATLTAFDTVPVDTAEDAERVRLILQQSTGVAAP